MRNKKSYISIITSLIVVLSAIPAMAVQPSLSLSSVTVEAGDTFQLTLSFDTQNEEVSALSTDIEFDSSLLQITDVVAGESATAADKQILYNQVSSTTCRIGIISLTGNDAIPSGVVAYVSGNVSDVAPNQVISLSQAVSASTPLGLGLALTGSDGTIIVGTAPLETPDTCIVLSSTHNSVTVPAGSYYQVYGSPAVDTLNVETGGRLNFINPVAGNVINIEEASSRLDIYRSGATVYLSGTSNTLIKIPATTTDQTLRFADGSSALRVSNGDVMLGTQVILTTQSDLDAPVDTSDRSTGDF